jgi:hypothetical protein
MYGELGRIEEEIVGGLFKILSSIQVNFDGLRETTINIIQNRWFTR